MQEEKMGVKKESKGKRRQVWWLFYVLYHCMSEESLYVIIYGYVS